MIIEVDNVNQAKSHKWVCHILKNTLGTCFIPNFQRVINGLRYVRSGASKSGRVPQVGMSYSQKHTWHMFYTQFFKRNRLGMISDMSEAPKSCPSTSTTSTRPSPPLVGLDLVDVVNVDGHDLGGLWHIWVIPNRFLLKNWILNMYYVCFWKYDVPTCGTWPGWRCRRRWAWLGGLWHIWDHSQSISLEKLDIKHVSYMFSVNLTNSLSCFHW